MNTKTKLYQDDGCELEGFVAYPSEKKCPLVILCHAWKGRDEFICKKAQEIARLGYVGFALDMYGKGVQGKSREENAALKKPFLEDRLLLLKRVTSGFEAAKNLPFVDPSRIAVVGYGFGAVCALDLARGGVGLKGVVSVYGHFKGPHPAANIQAKVLILHGYKDPVTPQEELLAFEKEMSEAGVDWQAHIYGDAMHAFATPEANDPQAGIQYHPLSAARAAVAIENFLAEVLE